MRKLSDLLDCNYNMLIESIEEDSRIKAPNSLFCCIKGLTVDGHNYVNEAIKNGAVAILASDDIDVKVPVIKVKDTNIAMSETLSKFYNEPDKKMKLIGITGTDGKTTLSSIIYQLLNNMDTCGYIGTNGILCNGFQKDNKVTTPFPKDLYKYLKEFYNHNCKYVSMEISSERLFTDRLDALQFDIAVFTNITREHLDKHKTMENYIESKCKLFKLVKKNGYCIINNDDKHSDKIKKSSNGKVITYGIDNNSDIMASDISITEDKLSFKMKLFDKEYEINSPLSGKFNVYNLMAATIVCKVLGFNTDKIIDSIKQLKPIKSRMESLDFGQPYKIIIDYAHTQSSLKSSLEFINIIKKGKVITVTGAAGGRDGGKRSEMGEVVTNLSDYVIFTTDDPRFEDPNKIIDELLLTVKDKNNYERVIDRGEAIRKALSMAEENDTVFIAGKGHDSYIVIGNDYVPYCDVDEIKKYFIQS